MPCITPRHAGRPLTEKERLDLERRALVTWFKDPDNTQHQPTAPVQARSASKAKPGTDGQLLHFVVVHAGTESLAVYRARPVKDFFMLRRLTRWPRDLVRLRG